MRYEWQPRQDLSVGAIAPPEAWANPRAGSGPVGIAPLPHARIPTDPEAALAQLERLGQRMLAADPERWGAGKHDTWMHELVMVCHHETQGSAEGRALCHRISAQFGGYDAGVLDAKWRSLGKKGGEVRALGSLMNAVREAEGEALVANWLGEPADDWLTTWNRGSVGGYLLLEAPERRWELIGVLLRGKVTICAGPGGHGKTMLIYSIFVDYVLGRAIGWDDSGARLFEPCAEPGRVVILSAEDDADDVHHRIRTVTLGVTFDEGDRARVADRLAIFTMRGLGIDLRLLNERGQRSALAERLVERLRVIPNLRVLVLDPAILFAGINENDSAEVTAFLSVLDWIAVTLDVAVVLVAHTNKAALRGAGLDQGAMSGHSAWVNLARALWLVRAMTAEDAYLRPGVTDEERRSLVVLSIAKNNYGPSGREFVLQRNAQGRLDAPRIPIPDRVSAQQARAALRDNTIQRRMADFLKCVEANPGANVHARTAALSWDVKTEKKYRDDANAAGYVERHGDTTPNAPVLLRLTPSGKKFVREAAK